VLLVAVMQKIIMIQEYVIILDHQIKDKIFINVNNLHGC
jgi:hypothetical protein